MPARLPFIDAARGLALWAMFVFHLVWDLAQFGWIDRDVVFAPEFRWFGHAIAASFLLLVGVSLVLASRSMPLWNSGRFWRRWATIVAAAAAISAVSLLAVSRGRRSFSAFSLHRAGEPDCRLPSWRRRGWIAGLAARRSSRSLAPHLFASTASMPRFSGGPASGLSSRPATIFVRCCPGSPLSCSDVASGQMDRRAAFRTSWRGSDIRDGNEPRVRPACSRATTAVISSPFAGAFAGFYLLHQPRLFG